MVEKKSLTPEEAAAADMRGIEWFLKKSDSGTASDCGGGNLWQAEIRRFACGAELPFTWAAPLPGRQASDDSADWPTIRGVIDALIVDMQARTAEIIDYKTDSAFLWESRLPEYQRQMGYYLRAASEILGFKVEKATLVFLSPRIERVVTL